jgi:hypothetical protein
LEPDDSLNSFLRFSEASKLQTTFQNQKISIILDHRQQLVIIFNVNSNELKQENIDLNQTINEGEVLKILDKQNIRFEIDQNHKDSAILTIPTYRVTITK